MSECVRNQASIHVSGRLYSNGELRSKRQKSKRVQRSRTLILGRSSPSLAVPCSQFTANLFSAPAQKYIFLVEYPSEEVWNPGNEGFQSKRKHQHVDQMLVIGGSGTGQNRCAAGDSSVQRGTYQMRRLCTDLKGDRIAADD
jgi:hypothetical protein